MLWMMSPFGGGRGRTPEIHPLPPPAGDIEHPTLNTEDNSLNCKTA